MAFEKAYDVSSVETGGCSSLRGESEYTQLYAVNLLHFGPQLCSSEEFFHDD